LNNLGVLLDAFSSAPATSPALPPSRVTGLLAILQLLTLRESFAGITLPPADRLLNVGVAASLEAEILNGFRKTGTRDDILGFSPGNFYEALFEEKDLPKLHYGPLWNLQSSGCIFHEAGQGMIHAILK